VKAQVSGTQPKMGLLSVTALGIFFEIDVLGLSYIHLYK
jgi:hypothetical protein